MNVKPRLSICMATFNRGAYIAQTLASILPQLTPDVELVIVNGNSPDNTDEVLKAILPDAQNILYFHEDVNSGVDADYDKAVVRSNGEYCWLMTDDDLVVEGAIERLLAEISGGHDLVVCNAQMRNADLSTVLKERFLDTEEDRIYAAGDLASLFPDVVPFLSFIGAVVVRRELWLARERPAYFGSLFIHVGVLFQSPYSGTTMVIAEPQVLIRYGNSMWTPRTFEVWMIKWPALLWSFTWINQNIRQAACQPEPWRRLRKLGIYRAIGAYSLVEFDAYLANRARGLSRLMSRLVAVFPTRLANALAALWCWAGDRNGMHAFDLARSQHSTVVSRWVARRLGVL